MTTEPSTPIADRETLTAWAREQGVRVRISAEDWDSITYEALYTAPDGTPLAQRYRCVLPASLALRRLRLTYVVGLCHDADGAACNHVRRVVPPVLSVPETAARHDVSLVAAALVESERRAVCGATVENLAVYTVQRAQDWQPL